MIKPDWSAPANVKAFFTTRLGGLSQAPYNGLNLGTHVGDDAAKVEQNRVLLSQELHLPNEPEWMNQTHSTRVVTLEDETRRDADAAITRRPGRVAVVMVADCLPVLVSNRDGSEIAAIHAGWRGLQGGVIQASIEAMQSNPADLTAWIGPAISKQHFEVGDEVREAFVDSVTCTDIQSFFTPQGAGHWMCDLPAIAEQVLIETGVSQTGRSRHCTYAEPDLFFSYRREAVTGRQAALIWIN
ncbi:MAG: peptidoglycan editing factor PgeF [Pseudomonadota bacterium]